MFVLDFAAMRLDAPHEELAQSEHDTLAPILPPLPMTPSSWPSSGSVLPSYPQLPYAPTASMASGYAPMPYPPFVINETPSGQQSAGGSYPSLNNNFAVPPQTNLLLTAATGAPAARSEVNSSTSGGSGGSSGSDGRKAKKLSQQSSLVKDMK